MPQKIAGITVATEAASIVILNRDGEAFEVVKAFKISLQNGPRARALQVFSQQIDTQLRAEGLEAIYVKATEAGMTIRKAQLDSAETRGAAIAAAAGVAEVTLVKNATVSRTFGDRKVAEYLGDGEFWKSIGLGGLLIGMREAAFVAVASTLPKTV